MTVTGEPVEASKFHVTMPGIEHRFIEVNGTRMHYVTAGQGPLMLMLHGFPEFWYSYRHQIPVFAKSFKVVALDLPGYNDSAVPANGYDVPSLTADLAALIEKLGYEKAVLMAHDWGGALAWNIAINYPEKIEKLIILNMPHPAKLAENLRSNPRQMLRSWYVLFFQLPWLPEKAIAFNNYKAIENTFRQMAVHKEAFSDADIRVFKEALAKPGVLTAALNYYRGIFKKPYRWYLANSRQKVKVPTLMVWGEHDTALGKEVTYGTEEWVPNLTIKYIPDASHWVQQDTPEKVNQYILEWL
jgi:pimeloyl-ACP methyl ester carboxylesterase